MQAKAYTTRVGSGPYPTELLGDEGEELRQAGFEWGTTTGRPRRCGWLDVVALNFACTINGFTAINLTKLDVLSGLDEVKLGVAYRTASGEKLRSFPSDLSVLEQVEVSPTSGTSTFLEWCSPESMISLRLLLSNERLVIPFTTKIHGW